MLLYWVFHRAVIKNISQTSYSEKDPSKGSLIKLFWYGKVTNQTNPTFPYLSKFLEGTCWNWDTCTCPQCLSLTGGFKDHCENLFRWLYSSHLITLNKHRLGAPSYRIEMSAWCSLDTIIIGITSLNITSKLHANCSLHNFAMKIQNKSREVLVLCSLVPPWKNFVSLAG